MPQGRMGCRKMLGSERDAGRKSMAKYKTPEWNAFKAKA